MRYRSWISAAVETSATAAGRPVLPHRRTGGQESGSARGCATNRNLEEEIENGTFRQDLFYRINVVNIYLPPLRERRVDIESLVNFFLEYYNRKYNARAHGLSHELMQPCRSTTGRATFVNSRT